MGIKRYSDSDSSGGGGGVTTVIDSGAFSGISELEFTTGISKSHLRLELIGLKPDIDSMNMDVLASVNNGSSYYSSSGNYRYQYASIRGSATSVSMTKNTSASSWVDLNFIGGDTGESAVLTFDFYNLDNATEYKHMGFEAIFYETNGQPNLYHGIGEFVASTSAVDAIKLVFSKATSCVRYALYEVGV